MVFLGKKEQQRRKRMTKKFQAEIRSGRREPGLGFGFAAGRGGPFLPKAPSGPSPSFGVQTPEGIRISRERGIGGPNTVTSIAQPISVPRVSGTKTTRRELQLSEGKKGDLFCEIKIIKGKRKRVCKVKTTDKKRKKPIRVTRSVDKQFGFFRRIL